jgi:hypothetical protein
MQKPISCWLCSTILALFAARAVYTNWLQFRDSHLDRAAQLARHDVGSLGNARFSLLQELQELQPPTHIVGYLTQKVPPSQIKAFIFDPHSGTVVYRVPRPGEGEKIATNYVLAQYALAPLIVDDTLDQHLVIADFPSDAALLQAIKGTHLTIVDWVGHAAPGLAVLENPAIPATQPEGAAGP